MCSLASTEWKAPSAAAEHTVNVASHLSSTCKTVRLWIYAVRCEATRNPAAPRSLSLLMTLELVGLDWLLRISRCYLREHEQATYRWYCTGSRTTAAFSKVISAPVMFGLYFCVPPISKRNPAGKPASKGAALSISSISSCVSSKLSASMLPLRWSGFWLSTHQLNIERNTRQLKTGYLHDLPDWEHVRRLVHYVRKRNGRHD